MNTTAEEMPADLTRLRALIEQHEERARVHAEERAAHYAEMARVTGECETLRRTLALSQESLAAAVRDERVTVVDEVARLQRELAAARAALREHAPKCDGCGAKCASFYAGFMRRGSVVYGAWCGDCPAIDPGAEAEHAAALRAATVTP
jgi:hypothetical protein